ncbi:ctl-like protein 1-like protein [Lasius niger]|uniref:Choline transporter-like protein n=1 Tax=Lasius niger TaxID=67767 RepID=A0A0J7KJI0_LASNI|nr:ctl-like protein 1-like protein [Lasius niger]
MSCCTGGKNEEAAEPMRVRGCTDVFWLCLFITFWFLMILIAAFAIVYGNPIRLINGYDSFGNTCGMKNNPKFGSMELSGQDTSDKPPGGDFSACNSQSSKFKNGSCPEMPIYAGTPVLNRCIPKAVKDVTETIISNLYGLINSWDVIEQVLGDLYQTWRQILALAFLACVLSLLTISIFHLLANLVTWIIIVLVSIACTGGTILLWMTYIDIKKTLDKTDPNELLEESVRNERAFLAFSIIATIITITLLFLSCILRKRISFMAALFKESAKCLKELPGLFFEPILTFITLIMFFAFWVFIILCLATANYPETKSVQMYKNNIFDPVNLSSIGENAPLIEEKKIDFSLDRFKTFTLVEYVDATWVKYMWWVYVIGLIWTSEFIIGCQTMVISGSVAHWYFRGKNASTSPTNFNISAYQAFTTLVSNALQIAVINGFGDFILFLGKCFVTAVTGSVALLLMRQDPKLHFYAIPIFIVCVFSFFIAHCIISLYETVIDTLFLCVCEDKNLNGENGKWRQSALAQIGASSSNTNGQQSHEMTPINE